MKILKNTMVPIVSLAAALVFSSALLLAPHLAEAAPTRTGTASEVDGSAGSGSISVTVPADATAVVAFWSHWDGNGGSSISALTLNGAGFTIVEQQTEGAFADENGTGVAVLTNPATGSQTFAWTWSAGGARTEGGEIILVYVKDANIGDVVRDTALDSATETNDVTVTVTSETTDLVLGFAVRFDNTISNPGLSGTVFIDDSLINDHLYDVSQAAAGLPNTTFTMTAEEYSSMAAISLKEDTGAVSLSRPPNNLGLVGYWPMDEGTGTMVGDHSGFGNHGTQDFGTIAWTPGKRNNALYFGGTQFSTAYQTRVSTSTYSAWIYPTTSEFDLGWIVRQPIGNAFAVCDGDAVCGGFANTIYFLNTRNGTNGEWYTNANTLRSDEWNHVLITYDESLVTNDPVIYINGVSVTVNNPVTPSGDFYSPGQLYFGSAGGAANYIGVMDELRFYNRILSATEIAALARGGAARVGASSVDLARGSSLEQGLVGHWTFDGKDTNWTSDTAGTVTDMSGSGNTGTMTNMNRKFAVDGGILGQALKFNGTNTEIDYTGPNLANSSLTYAAWFYAETATPPDEHIIVSLGSEFAEDKIAALGIKSSGDIQFDFYVNVTTASAVYSLNRWHHVAGVYDQVAGTRKIYLDGVEVATESSVTAFTGNTDGAIGYGRADNAYFFDGKLDDVRIYNRALTAAEAKQLFNLGQVKITQ